MTRFIFAVFTFPETATMLNLRQVALSLMNIVKEFLAYLMAHKKTLIIPVILFLLILFALLLFANGTALSPFMYDRH